ncbi:hypothetical protein mvi_53330 [Methylobacterium indicum]|uniref:Uncharacterized protein n=1 Tax=Methylobacterium indicum TaxID=1775910 RepID=A0A8H8WZ60_9HYPH|nr:hypothetical protein mvi_53330 [Methylobacterium indicum]
MLGRHVTPLGATEAQFVASGALSPAQAEAAGFPLSAVLAGIDAAALAGRDAAVAEAAALRRERDALAGERDGLAAQLAAREAPAADVLPAISDRQFFQALALAGAITPDAALAAVMTGRLPAPIEAAVTALPAAERFAARMLLSGATAFERGHPMVAQLGAAIGYDAAALDALWRQAAAL